MFPTAEKTQNRSRDIHAAIPEFSCLLISCNYLTSNKIKLTATIYPQTRMGRTKINNGTAYPNHSQAKLLVQPPGIAWIKESH